MKVFMQYKNILAVLLLAASIGSLAFLQGAKAASSGRQGKFSGMVHISAGPFTMGRNDGPADEGPAHRVFLSGFRIDRNLVTNGHYARFIQAKGPLGPRGEMYLDVEDSDNRIHQRGGVWLADQGYEQYPASELSWHGAVAYCKWIGKRLPSEAEWEKAARGQDGRIYPWGNEMPGPELAFFGGFRGETVPVGRYPKGASPYGVLDMAGQVWEWTTSIYRPYPYDPKDGRENLMADESRVARGGSSSSEDDGLTATSREVIFSSRAATGHAYFGFRCAVSMELVL
jgi:iron(II)-dependent oxidoreductase